MKALILNSGTGSRMENLTTCKCLLELCEGVTIIDSQIVQLGRIGIRDIYVTTGPHSDILEAHVRAKFPDLNLSFIHNPLFNNSNYIYSMFLASEMLRGSDIILMHGDIVCEQSVLQDISAASKSVMVTDSEKPLPEKDFKAVIKMGKISYIGVDAFNGSVYAQPVYKILKKDYSTWADKIKSFCERGEIHVYAENALDFDLIDLFPLDITGRECFEADDRADLARARESYRQMPDRRQDTYAGFGEIKRVNEIISTAKRPFIVCSRSVKSFMPDIKAVFFHDFTANPDINQAYEGIRQYTANNCDYLISLGGGSAIDVAKSVNILSENKQAGLLEKPRAKHLSIPSTAGTGSEATHFAVLYNSGEKLSIEHEELLPDYVILDPGLLTNLPDYHKKSTLLDALCQAIEAIWAKGKTDKSRAYALSAMRIILEDTDSYFANNRESALRILQAANLAGKAINISKTTAAHAMSYKLSSVLNIAHGHAVALCLPLVWAHLIENNKAPKDLLVDRYNGFLELFAKLGPANRFTVSGNKINTIKSLAQAVNPQRLSNHPIEISQELLVRFYSEII